MTPQIATILGLVIMFIVATALPINMGAVAFALAFIIGGVWVGLDGKEVLAGLPATCSSPWSASPICSPSHRRTAPSICWCTGRCARYAGASWPFPG